MLNKKSNTNTNTWINNINVNVERSFSAILKKGTIQATPGSHIIKCIDVCDFETLYPGDMIRIGGENYGDYYSSTSTSTSTNSNSIVMKIKIQKIGIKYHLPTLRILMINL